MEKLLAHEKEVPIGLWQAINRAVGFSLLRKK
jgi:hypothetical protein